MNKSWKGDEKVISKTIKSLANQKKVMGKLLKSHEQVISKQYLLTIC